MAGKTGFYRIPLRMDKLMRGDELERIEIRKSIHQNIGLMLRTLSMSYQFDPGYGSVLNKYHARTPPQNQTERSWREEMRERIQKNLLDMLQRYETRISVTDVFVDLRQPDAKEKNPLPIKVIFSIFKRKKLQKLIKQL